LVGEICLPLQLDNISSPGIFVLRPGIYIPRLEILETNIGVKKALSTRK
jgi:hypothetical protein